MIAIFLIKIYQKIISPILNHWIKCRFYPTCSEYAILAVDKYGTKKGILKSINRLKRCNKYNFESCIDYP
jgi:hypothetical protein